MFEYYVFVTVLYYSIGAEYIHCSGTEKCYTESITCDGNNDNCFISCDGNSACAYSTIICPSTKCYITCNNTLSCHHLTVVAQESLSLHIISSGYESLSFSHIYCPQTLMMDTATCNIAYSGHLNGLNMMSIYTVSDYNDVNLKCDSINTSWSSGRNPMLHFDGNFYSETCKIYNANICTSENSFSDIQQTDIGSTASHPIIYAFNTSDIFKLIIIGVLVGMMVSLWIFIIFFCIHHHHGYHPHKRKSLQSPDLKPLDIELAMIANMNMSEGELHIVPEDINSPKSIGVLQCDGIITDGIAPDEFIVNDAETTFCQ